MAIVAKAAQAHRRHTVRGTLTGKRIQVIDHAVYITLHGIIASDHYIAFPQFVPGFFMKLKQPLFAL